jgi:hypothetical protein
MSVNPIGDVKNANRKLFPVGARHLGIQCRNEPHQSGNWTSIVHGRHAYPWIFGPYFFTMFRQYIFHWRATVWPYIRILKEWAWVQPKSLCQFDASPFPLLWRHNIIRAHRLAEFQDDDRQLEVSFQLRYSHRQHDFSNETDCWEVAEFTANVVWP